ncbi:hypothetical protein F4823DRAFT_613327 [Ustulina deusta]|nr:hypothetical protein F4823DRAFT_613327 [Ustulina deusta]
MHFKKFTTFKAFGSMCLSRGKETVNEFELIISQDLVGNSLEGRETFIENPISHLQGLMIRDSVKEFGTNIVRYYKTYKPEDIGTVKAAWNSLFTQEAILCVSYSEDLEP